MDPPLAKAELISEDDSACGIADLRKAIKKPPNCTAAAEERSENM